METVQKSSKFTTLNWVITHPSSTDQTTFIWLNQFWFWFLILKLIWI